jgi:hypothetical protein
LPLHRRPHLSRLPTLQPPFPSRCRPPDATVSVALNECAKGNTAAAIPVLEKKLRDGRFTRPPRG